MTETGDNNTDDDERLSAASEAMRDAWSQTLEDMRAMADARTEEGWTALAVPAGDTGPESQEMGDTDRFGLTFVIPGNYADEFDEAFRRGTYPRYEVYRQEVDGRVFLVVEYLDPEIETTILVAGNYELGEASGMVHDAEDAGEMFTHHQKHDDTHIGTFQHDTHEKFVPHADRIDDDE